MSKNRSIKVNIKKSHTCEEGGVDLRISFLFFFFFLFMNLKNNYLLKNLLKWANKTQKNFNIYNVPFFKKLKEALRDLPFYPSKNSKNKNFEKMINLLKISSFAASVPKIAIIWYPVPEIPSGTDMSCVNPDNPGNQNFKQLKKTPWDIIIFKRTP